MLGDGVEQRRGLQPVARGAEARIGDAAGVDRLLHRRHDQPLAELGHAAIAELERLGKVVAGVDVHHGEREPAGAERLLGEAQQDDRVLAAAEQQHRALELGGHLAHDEDGVRLEGGERRLARPAAIEIGTAIDAGVAVTVLSSFV